MDMKELLAAVLDVAMAKEFGVTLERINDAQDAVDRAEMARVRLRVRLALAVMDGKPHEELAAELDAITDSAGIIAAVRDKAARAEKKGETT